ncbi:MAG: hypothetical protein M3Y82_00495 [Verrucomicrobiota bacterium]|nr:hypothetical protein [Verrucomicrobiota bacterium]
MQNNKTRQEAQERLSAELSGAADDAQSLIHATGEELAEKTKQIRDRLTSAIEIAKATYDKIEEQAVAGAKATDEAIRTYPYPSLGIAVGAGLLVGFLIKRK